MRHLGVLTIVADDAFDGLLLRFYLPLESLNQILVALTVRLGYMLLILAPQLFAAYDVESCTSDMRDERIPTRQLRHILRRDLQHYLHIHFNPSVLVQALSLSHLSSRIT